MFWALLFFVLVSSWFLPWWAYLAGSFLIGFAGKSAFKAFLNGFFATGLAWTMAAYYQDLRSENLISLRLSAMFSLPHPSYIYLLLILISGISSGLFCVAGYYAALKWSVADREKAGQSYT